MKDKLIIFDTTLRDGEQSPGASMTRDEKLRIARQLERMRVDVIEAGFAAASNGDFESVRAIAEAIKESTVCSLARANGAHNRRARVSDAPAARPPLHHILAPPPRPPGRARGGPPPPPPPPAAPGGAGGPPPPSRYPALG